MRPETKGRVNCRSAPFSRSLDALGSSWNTGSLRYEIWRVGISPFSLVTSKSDIYVALVSRRRGGIRLTSIADSVTEFKTATELE